MVGIFSFTTLNVKFLFDNIKIFSIQADTVDMVAIREDTEAMADTIRDMVDTADTVDTVVDMADMEDMEDTAIMATITIIITIKKKTRK